MDAKQLLSWAWITGNTLLVILLLGNPSRLKSVYVDRIEINTCHCYSAPFRQVIFWEWNPEHLRYDVIGWCQLEHVDFITGGILHDSGWAVRSKIVHRSESLEDPEKQNLKLLSDDYRTRMPWERLR